MGEMPGQACPFWLELGGSALREDFPLARRKLVGDTSGIVVGRSHQGHIFLEALRNEVRDEILRLISREHFRIVRCPDSTYRLEKLTNNSMWRVRPGERVTVRKGGDLLPLAGGDIILLFSGAADGTPDGPGSLGTLFFNFCDAQESAVTMGTRDALVATGASCASGFYGNAPQGFPQGDGGMMLPPHDQMHMYMSHGGQTPPHPQHAFQQQMHDPRMSQGGPPPQHAFQQQMHDPRMSQGGQNPRMTEHAPHHQMHPKLPSVG
jgi:hypothetical protein